MGLWIGIRLPSKSGAVAPLLGTFTRKPIAVFTIGSWVSLTALIRLLRVRLCVAPRT